MTWRRFWSECDAVERVLLVLIVGAPTLGVAVLVAFVMAALHH